MSGCYTAKVLASALFAATILAIVHTGVHAANDASIALRFKIDGEFVTLSNELKNALTNQADKIVRRCGYDGGDQEEDVWRKLIAEPSTIRLVYATPIQLRLPRREILISQAVFSLGDPKFLGQPILYHNGRTTLVAKCSGTDMLRLMCMPELKTYFPPGYQRNCDIVRQK